MGGRDGLAHTVLTAPSVERELERHVDICRQVYNHFLHELRNSEEPLSRYQMQSMLPELKGWWVGLSDVYSKVLQMVVKRVSDNLSRLEDKKDRGYKLGQLKWKGPHKYRSLTYNQVGFKLKHTSGQPVLTLSKIGDIPIRLHRPIPDDATIKQVTVKKEKTGEWFATFGVEMDRDPPEKPAHPENAVGIDVGILKYAHDTDGTAIESLDLSDERERLEREQRSLSRKEHGSANWEKQRQRVAERHADLKRKRRDFLHKLSNHYAREYDSWPLRTWTQGG
jgi:putative transposase